MVSLPHVIAAGVPATGRPPFGGPLDYLALGLYGLGLALETAADWQKWQFKQEPANKGVFCDVGVWQLSQHPNWVGNVCLWLGIAVLNAPTLLAIEPANVGWPRRALRLAGAAASPLFLAALFYAQATDTIANTAALAEKRYGSDPRFRAYVADTPLLVPNLASVRRFLTGETA